MKKFVLVFLGLLAWAAWWLEVTEPHASLDFRILPSVWRASGRTPLLDGLRAADRSTIVSYLLLTPESSLLSSEGVTLLGREEGDSVRGTMYNHWDSGQLVEVRPAIFTYPINMSPEEPPRWTEMECATIARRSQIVTGWDRSAPAAFIRLSNHGGCIMRLP